MIHFNPPQNPEITAAMALLGLELTMTGGGCTAYRNEKPVDEATIRNVANMPGAHRRPGSIKDRGPSDVYVTKAGDAKHPLTFNEPVDIGVWTRDGDEVVSVRSTVADFLQAMT